MKAAYIEKFGGPEVLIYGDLPDPVAGPGQVVVDTVAASINGADPKVCAGEYKQVTFPVIPGRDFSGVVSALGAGVNDLKVGDEVFGVLETGRDGTYCEKIAVGAAIVAKKPAGLSHVDATALALTGLTAIRAVEDSLKLKAGETMILIQGGAGGVAGFAIQLAKHLGARVISTASTANLDFVRGLGADQVIDYRITDFTPGREGLRRRVRHRGRRCRAALLRGAEAGRTGDLHRLRPDGAEARAQRRHRAAAGGRPRPAGAGEDRRTLPLGRGARAALSRSSACRRRARHWR